MGLRAPKSPKLVIFSINLPKKGIPLKRFFNTKFDMKSESQVRTFMPNFIVVTFKMWAYSPQNRQKLVIFGINLPVFAPNGSIPISDFYKIWREEVVPGPHAHANVFTVVTLKSGLTAPNRQKWYFFV